MLYITRPSPAPPVNAGSDRCLDKQTHPLSAQINYQMFLEEINGELHSGLLLFIWVLYRDLR